MTLNSNQFDPGKNPNQLRMLMTAPEIMGLVNTSKDLVGNETMDRLWERKLKETKSGRDTHGGGLYDKIVKKGYQGDPIPIKHEDFTQYDNPPSIDIRLTDGHHRVAAMAEADPNQWIPVVHKTWRGMDAYDEMDRKIQQRKKENLNKDQFNEEAPKPNGLDGAL